jgi:hypothetical protein
MQIPRWKQGRAFLLIGVFAIPAVAPSPVSAAGRPTRVVQTEAEEPVYPGALRSASLDETTPPAPPAEAPQSNRQQSNTPQSNNPPLQPEPECQYTADGCVSPLFPRLRGAIRCRWQAFRAECAVGRAVCRGAVEARLQRFAANHRCIQPVNPYYNDPRDGQVYSATGFGVPVSVPLAPNVRYTYNYGWGVPSSRLTPIYSSYDRWYPQQWYSFNNGQAVPRHPANPPTVYWPTDTTQLGFYYKHVPYWQPVPVPFANALPGPQIPPGSPVPGPVGKRVVKPAAPVAPAAPTPPGPPAAPTPIEEEAVVPATPPAPSALPSIEPPPVPPVP